MYPQQGDRRIRVMLVDDHRIVLWGMERLIDGEKPMMEVVATATTCENAIELAQTTTPDVVIVDVDLLREDKSEVIGTLANRHAARVLILSGVRDGQLHDNAVLHGACGVVRKEAPPATLLDAIRKVHEGQLWLDRATTARLFVELSKQKRDAAKDPEKRKVASLTPREADVVRTLATTPGADNRMLANSLHMGEHTLRNHLSRIYDKLGVPNRLELYVFAQRNGLNGSALPQA
jgi:two-component system, NarL family, nitrate/nitrite response regulator NarL